MTMARRANSIAQSVKGTSIVYTVEGNGTKRFFQNNILENVVNYYYCTVLQPTAVLPLTVVDITVQYSIEVLYSSTAGCWLHAHIRGLTAYPQ